MPNDIANAESLLRVQGLRKVYGSADREIVAVDDVDLTVGRGEVVGLLGANGAGKTTTIKCISGLVTATAGDVVIDGIDARRHRRRAAAAMSAVLEGNRTVYWRLDPRENIDYAAAFRGKRRREVAEQSIELLERFGLTEKIGVPVMKLSRGMQQKLSLACCLASDAPLLLLDEPTLGLDVETSRLRGFLRQLVADGRRGLVITSHDMRVIEQVCDRVVIINHGRVIVDDRVDNLLELFRARTVQVALDEPLSTEALERVRSAVDVVHVEGDEAIGVALPSPDRFYVLVDVLRSVGAVVRSIDQVELDLEEVFLTVIKERTP